MRWPKASNLFTALAWAGVAAGFAFWLAVSGSGPGREAGPLPVRAVRRFNLALGRWLGDHGEGERERLAKAVPVPAVQPEPMTTDELERVQRILHTDPRFQNRERLPERSEPTGIQKAIQQAGGCGTRRG